jgi:hypothetical protein
VKTKFLGLAVVLVAMAAIVNALALSSATVSGSQFTIPVVNTNAALIAVKAPASPDSDLQITDTATAFSLTVKGGFGVQDNATYTFDQAFQVKNNSQDAVNVNITSSGGPTGATLSLKNAADDSAIVPATTIALSAGTAVNVNLVVTTTGATSTSSTPFSISVAAVKQ